MKGKEGTGDLGGPDAQSGPYSSGSVLCPSGEKAFFADVLVLNIGVLTKATGHPARDPVGHTGAPHIMSELLRS